MYLLIRGSEDGRPISWLTAANLRELLADPMSYAGIREFRDKDDLADDTNYWPDGLAVLLRAEVVIPLPSGAYRLPDDDEAAAVNGEWVQGPDGPVRLDGVMG